MAQYPINYDEAYHANEGEYADDIPEAGVVWVVLKVSSRTDNRYIYNVFQSLGAARRHLQTTHAYLKNDNSEWWHVTNVEYRPHVWAYEVHRMEVQS